MSARGYGTREKVAMAASPDHEMMQHPALEVLPLAQLKPYPRNARTHSKKQISAIARSIERFGFNNPVLIDANDQIIAGHGRVAAAQQLGLAQVPTLRISHLSELDKRAYILADNRLAEKAGWDREALAIELGELAVLLTDGIEITGFETGEVDLLL
jgi:ParB-like chromosome segregation protein Spo0J